MKHQSSTEIELMGIVNRASNDFVDIDGMALISELRELITLLPLVNALLRDKIATGKIEGNSFCNVEDKCRCAYGWAYAEELGSAHHPNSNVYGTMADVIRRRYEKTHSIRYPHFNGVGICDYTYGRLSELEALVYPVKAGETAATNARLQVLDDALSIMAREMVAA